MSFDKAIVIFEDNTSLWYLKLLKRNFRHCKVVLFSDKSYVCTEINPMSNKLIVKNFHKLGLKSYLRGAVYFVVDYSYIPVNPLPFNIFSCVELVKRTIAIDERFIFTPYQLYTYLQKIGKKSLTFEKNCFTSTISQGH